MTHEHAPHRTPETAADWDARYGATHIWSGEPNGALMALTSDLAPGTALDVGCGEGADAVWLARRDWTVTGLDVSRVAVDRARAAAEAAGVEITWLVEGFGEHPLGPFDLVSAQYPAVPKRRSARSPTPWRRAGGWCSCITNWMRHLTVSTPPIT